MHQTREISPFFALDRVVSRALGHDIFVPAGMVSAIGLDDLPWLVFHYEGFACRTVIVPRRSVCGVVVRPAVG
jgi:hypothetical protein